MKLRWISQDLLRWQSDPKPVMVLTGARQVGKTTLARSAASAGFEYLALDDPILRTELSRVDSHTFARRYPKAILDEAQKSPALIETVKAIVDRGGPERYLLLGSSHLLLLDRVRESLAGRTRLRKLWPLGLGEILSEGDLAEAAPAPPALIDILQGALGADPEDALHQLAPNLSFHSSGPKLAEVRERWFKVGGMPILWQSATDAEGPSMTDELLREELETYVTLYLERDLADLARLRDLEPFIRLQRLAAERTSNLVALSDLSRDAGISTQTVKNYLRYLELSFQVRTIPPFFPNSAKRLVKTAKLCWTDIGVWRAVTRRWNDLPGELYESAVISEIGKIVDAFRLPWELYHLRTYDQREVDLLLVAEDRVIAFEIKSTERPHPRDARHLRNLSETLGRPCTLRLVLHRGREIRKLEPGIWAIPEILVLAPQT